MQGCVWNGRPLPSAPTSACGLKLGGDLARGTARSLAPTAQKSCRDSPGPDVEDRARCDGRMAAISLWRPGRWRARLRSDGTVSTIKYRALSALAMLGVEGARRRRERA